MSVKDANNAALILGVGYEAPILIQATQIAEKGDMIAKLNGSFMRLQGLRSNKKIDDLPVVCSPSAKELFEPGSPIPFWDMPEWDEVVSYFQRSKKPGKSESASSPESNGADDNSPKQKPITASKEETLKLVLTKWREYNPAEKGHSITNFIDKVLSTGNQGNAYKKARTALDEAIYMHGQDWVDEIIAKFPYTNAEQMSKIIWG